jgi:hypothetical protein
MEGKMQPNEQIVQIEIDFQLVNLQVKEVLRECDLTIDPNACQYYVKMQENRTNTQGPNDEPVINTNKLMQMDSCECANIGTADQMCMDSCELAAIATVNQRHIDFHELVSSNALEP